MNDRVAILDHLLCLDLPLDEVREMLKSFPWDSDAYLVKLTPSKLYSVLERYYNGEISESTLVDWANCIECREDIEITRRELTEYLHLLANPEINTPISKSFANKLMRQIKGD